MREYYLYEIEANEKPILSKEEWSSITTLTPSRNESKTDEIFAYGETEKNKYIALYNKG